MPREIHLKASDFTGQAFYVGIDVHLRSWTVAVRTMGLQVAHFTQAPDAALLARSLRSRYPGGHFYSAYEAGFCGTTPHHDLIGAGISNIIVHAADVPQSDKEKKNKSDLYDSRALSRYLEKGLLTPIHILPVDQQELRALFRLREAKVKDVTRATCRLRSLLYYFGVELPEAFRQKEYIGRRWINWLQHLQLSTAEGSEALHHYTEELVYQRGRLLEVTQKLKAAVLHRHPQAYACLITVPGIGPITAMALLAETGELRRFDNPDEFASYLGLVPSEQSTSDTVYDISLQPRCNTHLRPLLIEAAWAALRRCPVLLAYYRKHAGKSPKKAIVKVARKLALIARAVVLKGTTYQSDYVCERTVAQ